MKEEIEIRNINELTNLVENEGIYVRWKILSDIGPGWMGRKKEASFYSNQMSLKQNNFLIELSERMFSVLSNLMKYKDHVIEGKGNLLIKNNNLNIEFSWDGTIPYQYPDIKGKGEEAIYKLEKTLD